MPELSKDPIPLDVRMEEAMRATAPGTALRRALDMIIAGHLGALICVGDVAHVLASGNDGFPLNISFTANRLFELSKMDGAIVIDKDLTALICVGDVAHVLASGNDGFPLNISFTANRLFELSKMDGAIVIDKDLTQILRANFHLNPDPSLPTSETGMRHRTAARVSILTDAMVISVSERRQVVNVYLDGRSFEIRTVQELMGMVNQLLVTLQSTRQALDRNLLRLSTLELDNYVTLADVSNIFSYLEVLMTAAEELDDLIVQLGSEGRTIAMQREQLVGDMDEEYTLMIRDYAHDSSEENAKRVRKAFHNVDASLLHQPKRVGRMLGYNDITEDSVMAPLGLRTLNRVSVVREGMADKIVDEYGSLQELMDDIEDNPERLDDIGVKNPSILADSLYRMWGRKG